MNRLTYSILIIIVVNNSVKPDGLFDLSNVQNVLQTTKNKLLQWKNQKVTTALCPSNGSKLLSLLNLVCSTAQPTNTTVRDACYNCFARVAGMTEGPQILSALGICSIQYFANTAYASCANSVVSQSTSSLSVQPSFECYTGYCDFVRCLRRVNSMNLLIQCTREARTGVNITIDSDNVKFFTNVTSCVLAKARCGNYNPITGETQTPGFSSTGVRISNALQFSNSGDLRVLAFPINSAVSSSFCSASTNLTETDWLNNVC